MKESGTVLLFSSSRRISFILLPNILVLHQYFGYQPRKGILGKVMERSRLFLSGLSAGQSASLARWLDGHQGQRQETLCLHSLGI